MDFLASRIVRRRRTQILLALCALFLLCQSYFLKNTEQELTKVVSTLPLSQQPKVVITTTSVPTSIKVAPSVPPTSHPDEVLKVGTFNIWNYKNDWRSRLRDISQLIRDRSADIVGFQEVRRDLISETNDQFEFLRTHLSSEFPHSTFKAATTVTEDGGSHEEGLAIFSKHPIISTDFLEYGILQEDTDTNKRIALCSVIQFSITTVNFCVTHISYADIVQCRQASELLDFVNNRYGSKSAQSVTFIVGDLNTYIDYEYPIELLTRKVLPSSRCIPIWETINFDYKREWSVQFHDVWRVLHPGDKGFTFISNTPGLDSCRPDRILASNTECWSDSSISIAETLLANTVLSDHKALFAEFLFIRSGDCT